MLKRIFLLGLLGIAFFTVKANAQCAVYFCSITGAYGFCYGEESIMKARECAYTNCIKAGGTTPVVEDYSSLTGFGAICIGEDYYGTKVIGVAMGYDTQAEADLAAQDRCTAKGGYKLKVTERWEEK